jgi:hypothetical protein
MHDPFVKAGADDSKLSSEPVHNLYKTTRGLVKSTHENHCQRATGGKEDLSEPF